MLDWFRHLSRTSSCRLPGWITMLVIASSTGCTPLLGLEEPIQCRIDQDCWSKRGLSSESVCESNLCVTAVANDGSSSSSTSSPASTESSAGETTIVGESSTSEVLDPDLPPGPDVPWEGWECIGRLPLPRPTTGAMHTYRTQIINRGTSNPPINPRVRLCSALDIDCSQPVQEDVPVDEEGFLEIHVVSGFEGYFEFEGDDIGPHLSPLGGPVVKDRLDIERELNLVSEEVRDGIVAQLGVTADPSLGFLVLGSRDCADDRVAGVRYSIATETKSTFTFYFNGVLPSTSATETDASGGCGIVNVPPGFASVTAERVDLETGDVIEVVAQHVMPVRPNWITIAFTPPTP